MAMYEKLFYKGFSSTPLYSVRDKVIYGRLDGVDDFIFYQADSPADVEQAFKDIVDDYIDECREEGVEPQGMALVLA